MFSAFINSIALFNADEPWRQTFSNSIIGRLFWYLTRIRNNFQSQTLTKFASGLQFVGFLILLGLCISLGLRQFANDKGGLALIALGSFVIWLVGYVLGGKEERCSTSLDMIVMLFLGANVIATAASHYFSASLVGLAKVLVYIYSYFAFTAMLGKSTRRQIVIMSALVLVGFLVSLYGLYQYKIGVAPLATWEDPTIEQKGVRIYSTLGNPNLLAGYLVPLAPLAAALGVMAIIARKWLSGVLSLLSSAVICVAIVLTGSRGGWIGLFACLIMITGLVFCHVWTNQPRLRRILLLAGALIVAAVPIALHFVPTFEQRLRSIFAGYEHSSNAFRLIVWQSSFKVFLDNWWFGIGPGNQTFILAYGLYMKTGFDALGAYSVPLEVGVETGVFGLIAFAYLVICSLARGHVSFWQETSNAKRWLKAGAATALVGLMVHGLFDTVFYRPQVQFIFWLVLAMLSIESPSRNSSNHHISDRLV